MAPRKRGTSASSSSTASKKHGNTLHQSQPSKYGIQHFFERHSQSTSASATPPPTPQQQRPEEEAVEEVENRSPISPEVARSLPHKRPRFSPGMIIKQSQDDGGDEVTWRISPVNERLKSLAGKIFPGKMSGLAGPTGVVTRCSSSQEKEQNASTGRIDKWLSSPTMVAPGKTDDGLVKSVSFTEPDMCNGNGSSNLDKADDKLGQQSPFRTPPSVSYGPSEMPSANGLECNGALEQPDSLQHRKALLELLDQVENVVSVEVPRLDTSKLQSVGIQGAKCVKGQSHAEDSSIEKDKQLYKVPPASHSQNYLVLEVCEKHGVLDSLQVENPFKVLRLLDEQNGQERILYLLDEWFYSSVQPGDTINVIGEFDSSGKCVVDRNNNLLIVHPDILVSGTRVASSFSCPRRAVLDERLKCLEHSTSALVGTLLHQIFQAGLLKGSPTREFLEEYAGAALQRKMESLYACGANESEIYATLKEAIPKMLAWIDTFRNGQSLRRPAISFGQYEGEKSISISEVIDIEEMAWAPKFGLKGIIDASVRVKMDTCNGDLVEKIVPLEFKTGKATSGQSAMEHQAQVTLYTILMSERYQRDDINSGLLYYLHSDQTLGIQAQRPDLVGLIMRRNELASDILKAITLHLLPPMLQNFSICSSCRHLNACTVYHKAHGGSKESSGLGDIFCSHVKGLTSVHYEFLQHWDRLVDLEAKTSWVSRKELLHARNIKCEKNGGKLSSVVLDVTNNFPVKGSTEDGQYMYHFLCPEVSKYGSESHGQHLDLASSGQPNLDCSLKCGDHVILSTESGCTAVAKGVVAAISHSRISISCSRQLRLPGCNTSSEKNSLLQEVWRIDKDEVTSSYALMRYNLVQLFCQSLQSNHLRKLIVDLEAPRFDRSGIFSQDPAVSYIQSEKSLNDDQRRAIYKMLTAKDYALILGMPGTGKTSTMVHAVKALLIRGASILLTSYTNSAVDNLLLKLKAQEIDFVRVGRNSVVHTDIREHCFPEMCKHKVEEIKQRMSNVHVVGVTCLGVSHPLLTNKRFDICIMDEAGQITLPVSLGPLMFASTFVLVGDHYQLPPLVQSAEARENGMGISLFCRLSEANPQAISALQCQYRMSAGIMELSNALIYGNRLRCGSSDVANARLKISCIQPILPWLTEILDPNKSVVFIDTDPLPAFEARDHKTINNPTEACIISEITTELLSREIAAEDIGIITPYNSQADLIRQTTGTEVEIHTIDRYQGRDKDCILVSFVRSTEMAKACASSLLGDWHRINVALTRAKKKLIMVGSCKTLSNVPLLWLLIQKVSEQGGMITMQKKDFHCLRQLKSCSQFGVK